MFVIIFNEKKTQRWPSVRSRAGSGETKHLHNREVGRDITNTLRENGVKNLRGQQSYGKEENNASAEAGLLREPHPPGGRALSVEK